MIAPFRVGSLNNKLSDMNTVESRFLKPSVSRTSRYSQSNLVVIEFAAPTLYFSNTRFLETPDNSNRIWLPWHKLTPDNSNLRKFRNHLVWMSITFTPSRWLYILFFKGLNITYGDFFFLVAIVGKSHSSRLKVNNKIILHIKDSFRTLMVLLWQLLIEMLACFANLPDL